MILRTQFIDACEVVCNAGEADDRQQERLLLAAEGFYNTLYDIAERLDIHIDLSFLGDDGNVMPRLELVGGDDAQTSGNLFTLVADLDFMRDRCDIPRLSVDMSAQGYGLGSMLVGGLLSFTAQAGFYHYTLEAANSTGAYFWARKGFMPDMEAAGTAEILFSGMRERYAVLRQFLDAATQNRLDETLKLQEPETLWAVVDEVGSQKFVENIHPTMFEPETGLIATQAIKHSADPKFLCGQLSYIVQESPKLTLGKLLTCGLSYSAYATLRDYNQTERLKAGFDLTQHELTPIPLERGFEYY